MHDIAAAPLSTEHEGVSTYTTRMYSSTFYAQNPALEIVDQQSVNFYLHMYNGNIQHSPLCAEFFVSRIFPSLPGSRLRFFIAIQIQYSYEHTFVQQ